MTSTIDVFEAFTKLAPNANPKDVKTITDYMEENRRLNIGDMKEIFMTKDDKVELIEKISKSKTETIWAVVIVGIVQVVLAILAKNFL